MTTKELEQIKQRRIAGDIGNVSYMKINPWVIQLKLPHLPLGSLQADALGARWAYPGDKLMAWGDFVVQAGADIDALLEEITRLRRHLGEIP